STSQEYIREYTTAGTQLQSITIPASGTTDEDARDLVVASDDTVQLYNGTFDPILSTYASGTWTSRTYAGWSTVNNGSYGGVARSGNYVFVTGMTPGPGAAPLRAIIRSNRADGTATRFATAFEPSDLTIGQNGRLYALNAYGGVQVYHPETLALEQSFTLPYSIN